MNMKNDYISKITMRKTTLRYLPSVLAAAVLLLVACSKDDEKTVIDDMLGTVSVTESGGGTTDNPAVASAGHPATITLSQKSSYQDPNGKTFTCEPKASISMTLDKDTVRAATLAELLKLSVGKSDKNTKEGNPSVFTQQQAFTVGGLTVSVATSYEVHTITNSLNKEVEMPYTKLSAAQLGKARSEEEGVAQKKAKSMEQGNDDVQKHVAVTGIKLVPLPHTKSRAGSITTEQPYLVKVNFTVLSEKVHEKDETTGKYTSYSLEADYVGVVQTITEYPDPSITFSYSMEAQEGTKSKASPFVLGEEAEKMKINFNQTDQYSFFDTDAMEMRVVTYEPKAYAEVTTARGDTIWVKDTSELEKVTKAEPVISSSGENPTENTGTQVFTLAGKEIRFNWGYQSFSTVQIEGADVKLPYLMLGAPEISKVEVEEVPNAVLKGKKGKLYTVSVTMSQEMKTENGSETKSEQVQYVVKYLAAMAVDLVAIKYRKDYQWSEPHDNIPLVYHYMVYRDSIFSDGSVHTTETRSANTTMSLGLFLSSAHGKYDQTIEKVLISSEGSSSTWQYATVYYFKVNSQIDEAYRNAKATRTIAVPNLSLVTCEERGPREPYAPDLWSHYPGYNPSAPQVGWYSTDIERINSARIYYNYAKGGEFLTFFDISSAWYNHILYVKDDLNGGQLISFLGDASDIDDVDFRPQFDFKISEEATTMPTGEPAKVFTHTCVTTMLGKQFHYELVDTVYQYKDSPFEGTILE